MACVGVTSVSKAAILTNIATDYSTTNGIGLPGTYQYGSDQYTFGAAPNPATEFTTANMPLTASPTGYFGSVNSGCCGVAYPQIQAPITANDKFDQLLFHGVTNPSDGGGAVGGSGLPANTTVASDLRWTSNFTGWVTISGDFRAYNFCCGESQAPYVFVNGVARIGNPGTATPATSTGVADTNLTSLITDTSRSTAVGPAAGESSAGFDSGATNQGGVFYGPDHKYAFQVFLNAGDTVDWVSDPRLGFYGDLTLIGGQVNSVPEPASLGLLGLGALGLLRRRTK